VAEANQVSATKQEIKKTTRDYDELQVRLGAWLVEQLPNTEPTIASMVVPDSNGMSSETILLDVATNDGETTRYVVRIAPLDDAFPVFRSYDLDLQFRVMRLVAERSAVPVPAMVWLELDPSKVGSPFLVMERLDGLVPPDNLPYPFGDNWLSDASPEDQRRLQDTTIAAMAGIHGIELTDDDRAFLDTDAPGDTALRRHVEDQKAYHQWVTGGDLHPVITKTFDWLEANWPEDDADAHLSWGDGRVGNVMYQDFEPVGVLDWEMASLAPREVDLAWTIFIHRFFEDIVAMLELPGMPHFMRQDDVCETYEELTGYAPRDMQWYLVYAALRHGIVMAQVTRRAVAFGEAEMPADPDDLIMHKATLYEMLDGTYWDKMP
jgi:aminoglycoside phosphotransferase (APT) family kinase protein